MSSMFNKLSAAASNAGTKIQAGAVAAGTKIQEGAAAAGTKLQETAKSAEINSPLPTNLAEEAIKAAKILTSFTQRPVALVDGETAKEPAGLDIKDINTIPPSVIINAKGLAIFTVIKAGFITSVRAGNGLVVARLPDRSWSAPSCIATGGVGFGAQVGADITDFVIILNTDEAVKAFSQGGNLTLGGALSISAGPIGAGGEASVSANSVAAIFSYSKSKGLFAGISIEGTVLLERQEANAKFYGSPVKAEELLTGAVSAPVEAEVLYRAIEAAERAE